MKLNKKKTKNVTRKNFPENVQILWEEAELEYQL